MSDRIHEAAVNDESIILFLMRRELVEKDRSDDTIGTYISIGRRFEKFARNRKPPVEPELMDLEEALETVQAFAENELTEVTRRSLYVYEAALAEYLCALDPTFTRETFTISVRSHPANPAALAGRQRPSTPLTNQELHKLRRSHHRSRHPLWLRTVIELGITGLTWNEILSVSPNQASHFGQPPLIMMIERTIPIYETKAAEWLRGGSPVIYPSTANKGRPISLRLAKRELSSALIACRPTFGPGQGLRALHQTGAIRLRKRGKSLAELGRIYPRVDVTDIQTRFSS